MPDGASLRYRGLLYRALNPVWSRDPYSGEGARHMAAVSMPKAYRRFIPPCRS